MSTKVQHRIPPHHVSTQPGMHPDDQPTLTADQPRTRKLPPGIATPMHLPPVSARQGDAAPYLPSDREEHAIDRGYDHHPARPANTCRMYTQAPPRTMIRVTHHGAVPPRAHAMQQTVAPPRRKHPTHKAQQARPEREPRPHWVGFIGLALIVMVIGWLVLCLLFNWWQGVQDDWRYGRPRTFQGDAMVGGDSAATPTHFLALNLHGHISIIEIHAGDPNHTSMLVDPTTVGPLDPVILQFKDVNQDGKPDLLVLAHHTMSVFINEGNGTFRPVDAW